MRGFSGLTTSGVAAIALMLVGCGSNAQTPPLQPDAGTDLGSADGGPGADGALDGARADADAAPATGCELRRLQPGEEPFDTLDAYCFFGGDPVAHRPASGVVPFEPISPLYSDESLKMRFLVLPEDGRIVFDPDERWEYPEGTILIKTFYFLHDARDRAAGRRLLETRLLYKREGAWEPYIYVWNEAQTEARFDRLGSWIELTRTNEDGEEVLTRYRVPNRNQCKSCHGQNDVLMPLGPRTRQLNSSYDYGSGPINQLEHMASLNLFENPPEDVSALFTLVDPRGQDDLEARARSYLEANCAHCHNPSGAGGPSGLDLRVTVTQPHDYGVCRTPVAAGAGSGGLFYDIVPGRPEESIVIYRMASTDPEIKMPELPTVTSDALGVQIVSEWISSMDPPGCAQ